MFSRLRMRKAGGIVVYCQLGLSGLAANVTPELQPATNYSEKLPLSFEANYGQTDARVKYLARGPGYTLFLTEDSAVLSLQSGKGPTKQQVSAESAVLKMKLMGGRVHPSVAGADPLPGKSNYFVGHDPKQWRTSVPTYASVKYSGVYPGIDLMFHGNQRLLEYDFVLAPGVDPKQIDIRFEGARKLTVNRNGDLVIAIGANVVTEHAPVVYQQVAGQRVTVAGRYIVRGKARVGFDLGQYDANRALVIDPTLVYSTYLAGSVQDAAAAIAVDSTGDVYVTGFSSSPNFPITAGAFKTSISEGAWDTFVCKLNSTGSALIYSTYLGGSEGFGIAVDAARNAYVTGGTGISNFPTTAGALQAAHGGGEDAFVAKLNSSGSALVYSTYLGGSGDESASDIVVDTSGNAYVTGYTHSANFPTTPSVLQPHLAGNADAFVSKLNATGTALAYSTYLGGFDNDSGGGIAINASGNAYIAGGTRSTNFPVTPGSLQTALIGNENAFVTELNSAGSALVYSTYLGAGEDSGGRIVVDTLGSAYVVGATGRSDFPVTSGAFQTVYRGSADVFVAKLNPAGSALVYSTYVGGRENDGADGIALDAAGNAYITGRTLSDDFPRTPDALPIPFSRSAEVFVSKLNATGSNLLYSTYLGGSWDEGSAGIAVDSSGNVYVAGYTVSSDFPTTSNAFQKILKSESTGAFVSKLGLGMGITPLTTISTLSGWAANQGWFLSAITVTLTGMGGGTPVSATYYSLDGGPYRGYSAPFDISTDGLHQLQFYSVDSAGNQEAPHTQTIGVDKSAPIISGMPPAACTLWPPNRQMVQVANITASDAGSGILDDSLSVTATSNQSSDPNNPDIIITPNGSGGFIVQLRAVRSGNSSDRIYLLHATAHDVAGHFEQADATCVVPHDQR